MREILFRGKRKGSGEWVEGSYHNVDGKYLYILVEKLDITQRGSILIKFPVDPETVGQYTGLNVRGEKLFEGDIVKITDGYDNSVIYVVEFYMGGFSLKQKGVDYWAQFNDFHLKNYEFEILGNIHDNPELLKEGGEDSK